MNLGEVFAYSNTIWTSVEVLTFSHSCNLHTHCFNIQSHYKSEEQTGIRPAQEGPPQVAWGT